MAYAFHLVSRRFRFLSATQTTSNFDCHLRDWERVCVSVCVWVLYLCERPFEWNCCKLFPLRFWRAAFQVDCRLHFAEQGPKARESRVCRGWGHRHSLDDWVSE